MDPDFWRMRLVDRAVVRDLAAIQIEELDVYHCRGFTPEVVSDLSQIASIRILVAGKTDLSNESLNFLWSRLPNLEGVALGGREKIAGGFRDVSTAQKLKWLFLEGEGITDEAMANLRAAPGLEELVLEWAAVTEDCALMLASMPSLRKVILRNVTAGAAIGERLRSLNPRVVVEVEP
jgi:hypothetical protein